MITIMLMAVRKRHTLKLRPYPVFLVLDLDQAVFKTEQFQNAIGLTSKDSTVLEVNINQSCSKETQLEAAVHESTHVVQLLQDELGTQFDKETAAYWTQAISSWIFKKLALKLK